MERTSRATGLLTLLVTSLGSFMVLLDGSIVLVALPTIQQDLGAKLADLQWTIDAYTLPFAALMLTAGLLGDRLGRKKVFLTGLVVFLIGSALCGFAGSLPVLIAGRVVQGVGAAAIGTGSLALLVSTFTEPAARAKAIGIWTAVSGVSLALGPLVGGVLIEAFSWPAIFLLNLPVGILALALGIPRLLESKNPDAKKLDIPGQVLIAGGLFCFVMGLIQGEREGWSSPIILSLLIGSAVLVAAFFAVETRSSEPLLPLDLFRNKDFTVACAVASLLGFVIVGSMFFMAQYFQAVQGNSALGAGLRLLPLTLGIFFFSPPASRIAGKIGPRKPISVGATLVTAGFLLLATTIDPGTGFASVWWKLALVGGGIGCMFAPLTVAVMASTPPQRAGLGSSMINTTRIVGFTTGAAVLGTVVLAQFKSQIVDSLTALGVPTTAGSTIAEEVAGAGALAGQQGTDVSGLPIQASQFTAAINNSFVEAIHVAFFICAACTLTAAVLAAAFMSRGRPAGPGPKPQAAPAQPGTVADQRSTQASSSTISALVETDWLAERLDQPNVVVVDCTVLHRPVPTGGIELDSGNEGYQQGHIPGAVFADLLTELSDPLAAKPFGVPPVEQLVAALERLGISSGDTVIAYDRAHTAWATRFWWLLQTIGFENVAVLNGGWAKWTAEDRTVSDDTPRPSAGAISPRSRTELFASREDAEAGVVDPDTCLINALSPDQHTGRVPVAHGRSGHIPSSINVPAMALIDPETGAFRSRNELRSQLQDAGVLDAENVITYCAAGVNATSVAFILHILGVKNVSVYDGGLVDWSSDASRPLVSTS